MSALFQPAIPLGGYLGWRVLQNTAIRQQAAFDNTPSIQRDIQYFLDNIENATTPTALVGDRRLLKVALGAFGLDDEIDKKAFIKTIISGSTSDPKSFVSRLNEPRYKALTDAFGYGDITLGTNVTLQSFKDDIVSRYKTLEFERAVGDVDVDARLALNFKREIAGIAASPNVDSSGWFKILGEAPLRELVMTAFNLPDAMSKLDIDKQKQILEQKADQLFGGKSPAVFADPAKVEDAIRRFFLARQVANGPTLSTPGAGALALLTGSLGSDTTANLILSQAG
ncbi:MAG TPA: DUF1217 domain-containing protein [Parvularculaceae bacterium]|nr:DUF1217 domain-containing protein [Parvularculaceae bacterium]